MKSCKCGAVVVATKQAHKCPECGEMFSDWICLVCNRCLACATGTSEEKKTSIDARL